MEALLAAQRPGTSYDAALVHRGIDIQNLGLLPSTLPYAVVSRAEVGYDPPEPLVHSARFVVTEPSGSPLLDASFPVPDLLGQRLTLSYAPFDEEDEAVVTEYGGLFSTPPYLVEVRPVLKPVGSSSRGEPAGCGSGVTPHFRIELTSPGGEGEVENRVLAGNLTAIGPVGGSRRRRRTRTGGPDPLAPGLDYLDRWNTSDAEPPRP